jgi:hypothetical protein
MAEQTIKITGVFTAEGENGRGPWTRWDVKDAGGNKYSTFDEGLGKKAEEAKGKTATLVYEEEQKGQYVNRILKGVAIETLGTQLNRENGVSGHGNTAPASTKDEQIARAVAFKGAIDLAAHGILNGPEDIIAVAKAFEPYLLTGNVAEVVEDGARF